MVASVYVYSYICLHMLTHTRLPVLFFTPEWVQVRKLSSSCIPFKLASSVPGMKRPAYTQYMTCTHTQSIIHTHLPSTSFQTIVSRSSGPRLSVRRLVILCNNHTIMVDMHSNIFSACASKRVVVPLVGPSGLFFTLHIEFQHGGR